LIVIVPDEGTVYEAKRRNFYRLHLVTSTNQRNIFKLIKWKIETCIMVKDDRKMS